MALTDNYSDEELISELRMFFDEEDGDIDFSQVLSQVTMVDDETFEVRIRDRTFRFDVDFCDVEEVT